MKRVQRIVVGVSLLFVCGLLISTVVPSVPSGTWQATGDMAAPRTAIPKIVENVERVRRGETPLHLVDFAAGY